ncbi:elongation factor Tu GTP binding domain-containing protein [Besnoitia besnoiti]|uniref:Elongation factor Tu GTP binding domain-containing protein n=1 Tax=Besnoitia besnoiti TaxID=94643 RepID=A0A2A9M6F8_BESBE|nr:elongation factor Tu GTP binding domain-containing protein [Besnoitia besnoiti]PFH33565.1 elongation factor Tu GTP binding domain-containing protein [Besnoitia besnoiti]
MEKSVKCCCGNPVYANVGVLGHIDSGKTSLVRVLTAVRSTASLDKHPQSQERGITIDLGFSAFTLNLDTSCPSSNCSAGSAGQAVRQATPGEKGKGSCFLKRDDEEANTASPATGASSHCPCPCTADAREPFPRCTYTEEETVYASGVVSGKNDRETPVQICLVDCPGHASLIRTIIGGAQIIDVVLLVIDATKGIQTQTAECLVVAELLARHLIVVLNKIDLFPEATRAKKVAAVTTKLRAVFAQTVFGADVPIVAVAANPDAIQDPSNLQPAWNVEAVADALAAVLTASDASPAPAATRPSRLVDRMRAQQRCWACRCCQTAPASLAPSAGAFYLVFDHCFALKGKGTVLTGTVLCGRVSVGDAVVVLSAAPGAGAPVATKVRSLQTFRKSVESARRGQRVALCVTAVDASSLERGAVCDPQHAPPVVDGCIAVVDRIRFYKPNIVTGAKFHCTVGHTTTMCTVHFFGAFSSDQRGGANAGGAPLASSPAAGKSAASASSLNVGRLVRSWEKGSDAAGLVKEWPATLDLGAVYRHLEELTLRQGGAMPHSQSAGKGERLSGQPRSAGSALADGETEKEKPVHQFAILAFEKPIIVPPRSLFICSKLDMDISSPMCRLAFFGQMLMPLNVALPPVSATCAASGQRSSQPAKKTLGGSSAASHSAMGGGMHSVLTHPTVVGLPIYKWKHKVGTVERLVFDPPCRCSEKGAAENQVGKCTAQSLIGRGLFKSAQHVSRFLGFRVTLNTHGDAEMQTEDTDGGTQKKGGSPDTQAATKTARHTSAPSNEGYTKSGVPGRTDEGDGPAGEQFEGRIEKAFGSKGKFVVELDTPVTCSAVPAHAKGQTSKSPGFWIHLDYQKKIYDKAAGFSQA